ncbi:MULTISPECIES: ABC transporter permease [Bartonella]|uniref:ABC transporter permease n=2 Tax=Bartonellaceae TaxID=772 RepID=UPI0018DE968F|nr:MULTISPECIES: FtsX-like permease family protein [Bartonella]MBH9995291.1 FtsX-like permease family protein [Bartonella sp. P0291]MBH9996365.1 FtsX-like permease family protein [Bartonella sp. M0192]MBH9998526.1 FtsX-like permease family protein [Bartonella sp. M0191]MBI0009816.1 FtsX-like permease family protein [Bartonella sp. M0176]MBI0013064.1 FtsX-like permease family protein [Bartonella apihabitans]
MKRFQELCLAWRFCLREMRSGLKGFYIFLCLIALGVAAIGGVDGVSKNISNEIKNQGQVILAADIRFSHTQREANDKELAFFKAQGKISENILMRSMARRVDTNDGTLVEIKAVDSFYPLYGKLKTAPQATNDELFGKDDKRSRGSGGPGDFGVVIQKLLLDRLQLHIGEKIRIGDRDFTIRAVVEDEPDLLSEGFQLGPRVFMSIDALRETGLIIPGSLHNFVYRIKLDNPSDSSLENLRNNQEKDYSENGWAIRSRVDAAPVLQKNIERFTSFLTLIGLTALVVGGVGIANSVSAYMDKKRKVIAIFKALGARSRFIEEIYFSQIMLIALIGIVIGLVFAAIIPFVASFVISHYLPFFGHAHFSPTSLILAVIFALLTVSAFAILPLSRAGFISVTTLLRPFDISTVKKPNKSALLISAILLLVTAILAIATASDKKLAFIFIIAVIIVFLVLRAISSSIIFVARKCAHVHSTILRVAIANIYRPQSITPSVVLALGLGLTLLVTLSTIDSNLRSELSGSVPEKAPDFFFMDILKSDADDFSNFLHHQDPSGSFKIMPTLRARITKINGEPVKNRKVKEDSEWVLRGDRNITYSAAMPENTVLSEGQWWKNDRSDAIEVSVSKREANGLFLKLGDTITVNVSGREITARITSFRDVDWDSFNMNFVMIFSPQALQAAPHVYLATFKAGKNHSINEAGLMRDIANRFPSITVVPVHQVLDDARKIVDEIGIAIRASSAIAILAAILVLVGTLSSTNRSRIHDAVVLKTLGATRKMLLKAYLAEYTILGLATAVFAFVAGTIAGTMIGRYKMEITNTHFFFSSGVMVVLAAVILTIGFGLIGTWHILSEKPSRFLKEL